MIGIAELSGRRRRRFAEGAAGAGAILLPDITWVPGGAWSSGVETFARASTAVEHDSSGFLVTRAVDVARNDHYIGGVRTALREVQRTNRLLNSNTFTSGWSVTAANVLVTGATNTGPDNVASSGSSMREKATSATHSFWRQINSGASVSAGARYTGKLHIKPTAGRTNIRLTIFSAAPQVEVWLLLSGAGSVVSNSDTTAVPHVSVRALGNGYYEVNNAWVCQTTGASCTWQLNPSTDGVLISYLGVTSEGFDMYGAMEEIITTDTWDSCASSYIATAGSAVTRAADIWYLTLAALPAGAALTLYTKLIEQGALLPASAGATHIIFGTSGALAANYAQLMVYPDRKASMGLVAGSYEHSELTTPLGAFGQTRELRGVLMADGAPYVGQSLDGAAEDVSTPDSGQAFPVWEGSRVYLGCSPLGVDYGVIAGFIKISMKAGEQTMATMAAL